MCVDRYARCGFEEVRRETPSLALGRDLSSTKTTQLPASGSSVPPRKDLYDGALGDRGRGVP